MSGPPQSIDFAGLVEGSPGKVFILFDLRYLQKRRPRYGRGCAFGSTSILAGGGKLRRQVQKTKESFVMWMLWSYPQTWGLDNFFGEGKVGIDWGEKRTSAAEAELQLLDLRHG